LPKKQRVERTRGGGRYTESEFWSFIRSGLRAKHSRWAPRYAALAAARRPSKDKKNLRLKWQFQCAKCRKWKQQKEVQVDHIEECGSLRSFDDLPGFVERMFCEVEGYRILCIPCHNKITQENKKNAGK